MATGLKYLRLYLHDDAGERRAIGHLSAFGDMLRISFDDSYITDRDRPTLSLQYVGATESDTQAILRSSKDRRLVSNDGRWPAYFQNLLPEGHNRDRLAKERGCDKDDEFELLAAAGHDLMGAVEVEPLLEGESVPTVVAEWHQAMGIHAAESDLVAVPVEDAAAIPGVVSKFSAVQDGRRYVVKRNGSAGSYILKLPSTRHPDLAEIEYKGFQLCEALGLRCARALIIKKSDAELPEHVPFEHLLAVERFDRTAAGRIHMEEFAQAMGFTPKQKYGTNIFKDYGQILRVLNMYSPQPKADIQEFLYRFVAFVLLGNTDAHLKNWALLYPDGKNPVLAPVYDPVSVSSFFESASPLDYAINRKIDENLCRMTWSDLESLMYAGGLNQVSIFMKKCKEVVKRAQADWPELLKDAPASMQKEINRRLHGKAGLAKI